MMKNLITETHNEESLPEWQALKPDAGQRTGCWLACYDIADPKRLNRVYRLMSSEALAIQKSVFLVSMFPEELKMLSSQVSDLIDTKLDRVDFIRLPRNVSAISLGRRSGDDGILLL